MSKPGNLREAMPLTAEFIDRMREAFGAESVNAAIRASRDGQPTFWASENGHEFGTKYVPATRQEDAVRGCFWCCHRSRPGMADPGYCAERADLPFAYGPAHPLRLLPADGGLTCTKWSRT